jgi:hypothetical protein
MFGGSTSGFNLCLIDSESDPDQIAYGDLSEFCSCREQAKLENLDVADIGEGLHYVQEVNPHLIGEELATWYQKL